MIYMAFYEMLTTRMNNEVNKATTQALLFIYLFWWYTPLPLFPSSFITQQTRAIGEDCQTCFVAFLGL